jgi:hypothetical protein
VVKIPPIANLKTVSTIKMTMIKYLFIILLCLSCIPVDAQKNDLKWTKPDLKGHWKLIDTKIVDDVPFLNLHAPEVDPIKMVSEDSPWDHYTKYDLVFEHDSMYKIHYPIEAFESVRFFLDTGYLHIATKNDFNTYPAQLVNDTLLLYTPVSTDPGYFKETYVRTNFNDSILNVMKKYGVNYPALAGTWMLVREEDYEYGTHYEFRFPYAIPDSIELTREKMIDALEHERIFMMSTDGIKRDYSFWYSDSNIYFKPGKWYKEVDDPWIHFYKK